MLARILMNETVSMICVECILWSTTAIGSCCAFGNFTNLGY